MISALDSSVILDVVTDDPSFADASEALLRRASAEGQLVAGECVLAEIRPAFSDSGEFETFLGPRGGLQTVWLMVTRLL
jgi:hypothetical protein